MLQVSTMETVGAPTWGADWRVVDGAPSGVHSGW